MKRYASIPALVVVTLLSNIGCGGSGEPTGGTGGSTGHGGSGGTGGSAPARPWESAGIRGCAKDFLEGDGLCHPRADKCPAGTVAKFDEGCVPVGVEGCATEFLGQDGICHATMDACPAGTFAIPSEGCVPIDGPEGCGTGTWGPIADGPNTIWVDPAYAGSDSDGSKAKPRKTIAEALALAPEGGRIALAAGDYAEPIFPTKGVEIVGRCPSMVKVTGTAMLVSYPAVVGVADVPGEVIVRRIQVSGDGFGIKVRSAGGAKVTIDQVWVHDVTQGLVNVSGPGAKVTVHHALLADTVPAGPGVFGAGAEVFMGATLTLDATAVVRSHVHGVMADTSGTELTVQNSLIEATHHAPAIGSDAYGLVVAHSAAAQVDGTVITGNAIAAVDVEDGTDVSLKNSVVEKTLPDPVYKDIGYGVEALGQGTLTIEGSVIQDNIGSGLVAMDAGREVTVDRSLIAHTKPIAGTKKQGVGVYVVKGAKLGLTDTTVIDNLSAALHVNGSGSTVDALRSLFQGTQYDAVKGTDAYGITCFQGGAATLTDSAFVDNLTAGVSATADGSVTLDHSLVQGDPAASAGKFGYGVIGGDPKALAITSSAILSSRVLGVLLAGGVNTITGSVIRGVQQGQTQSLATVGDGVLSILGPSMAAPSVTIDGSLIESCDRAGVLFAAGSGTLRGSKVSKNQFGVVVQGGAAAEVAEDNEISGNTTKDRDDAGTLQLP